MAIPKRYLNNFVVLTTKYGCEVNVSKQLLEIGCRVIFPVEHRYSRVSRRTKKRVCRTYPLLPGYCVAGFPLEVDLYRLPRIRNVYDVLLQDSRPYVLTNDEVHWLQVLEKSRIERGGSNLVQEGSIVKIRDGPLSGMQTRVESIHKKKARVSVNILGSIRDLEILIADLELIDSF